MTPFARAFSRSRRTRTPAIYFSKGYWWVTYSGYSDVVSVQKAIEWTEARNS